MSHTKRSFTFQNYLLGVKRALPAEPVHRAERLRRAKRAVSNLQFASWALLCFFFSGVVVHFHDDQPLLSVKLCHF